MAREELPKEILWTEGAEGKHASELALSAFADGEESLLSKDVILHMTTCSECAMHLGETALVTRGVTHAVHSVKPWLPAAMLAPVAAKRPAQSLPWGAVFAALALTALGAAPTLLSLPHRVAELALTWLHAAPVVSHSGVQVLQQALGAGGTQAMAVCAALLIAAGVAVTRILPRPTVS